MTATRGTVGVPAIRPVRLAGGVVAAAGCVALVARPLLGTLDIDQTAPLVALFAGLLAIGLLWPPARTDRVKPGPSTVVLVAVVGAGAFVSGRLVAGAHSAGPFTARFVLLNALAAVAEEAFFRRFVFDLLLPGGAAVAVVGSAMLFAVVHVTVYGGWALPVDLAAGLVLGWQRLASGSWRAPAITHVLANVLAVL